MREYLRVKIASLAAEAQIIRREERRALVATRHARSQEHRDRPGEPASGCGGTARTT